MGKRAVRRLLWLVLVWGLVALAGLFVLLLPRAPAASRARFFALEPRVDRSPARPEDVILEDVQRQVPNLPVAFWNRHKNKHMHYKNESCAKLPSIFELEFNNLYWQVLHTTNGTFQLYGAYYDVRPLSIIGPSIRIIGMINRIAPTVKTFCQLWFEDLTEPVFGNVFEYNYIWNKGWGNYKQGIYQPYLIGCRIPLPYQGRIPSSVSLVEKQCDSASNNLRVIYNKPAEKKDFAVCVKGLDFLHEDLSVRLVEWIELLGILGADKIFFYELQVHPNISKVLRYYEQLNRVDVTPLTLPGGQPNVPGFQHLFLIQNRRYKRQDELIPYNDCFYKNLYSYKYITLLDIDEVIMPTSTDSWKELMNVIEAKAFELKNETRASYHVRNVYFFDDPSHARGWFPDIPKYMHMLQHVYRSKHFTRINYFEKCFYNPERVITVHNHFPFACFGLGRCTSYTIETSYAQLQHYRSECVSTLKNLCVMFRENTTMDTKIWRYKDRLIKRTTDTLTKLGFFFNLNDARP